MALTSMRFGNVLVVQPTQEERSNFQTDLCELLKNPEHANLVIDLSLITFATARFAGTLVYAYVRCFNLGGKCVLARPTDYMKQFLSITNLRLVISQYPDVVLAVASFSVRT